MQVWHQACSIDLDNVAVHVDVDFMTPFVTSVKKASRDVWLQLPPPVRQAAPYVGAGLGTGVLVFSIQQRRLDHAVSLCSRLLHLLRLRRDSLTVLLAADCQEQGTGAAT